MKIFWILICVILILFILIIWLIKPNKKRDISAFYGKMYAHRGLHDEKVPENSMTAFRLAVENGYGVELDVQMTLDGKLVVFHDGSLERMTGEKGFLRNYTYDQLQQYTLKGTDEHIPLFEDVLAVLNTTDLICELKSDNGNENYELCQKAYNLLRNYKGKYCIESFSPFLVKWFRIKHSEIIRGQLSSNLFSQPDMLFILRFVMSNLLVNFISRPDFISYRHKDTNMFGYRMCRFLYHPFVIGWTARGPLEQKSAWEKFDSIIFEKNELENPVE